MTQMFDNIILDRDNVILTRQRENSVLTIFLKKGVHKIVSYNNQETTIH